MSTIRLHGSTSGHYDVTVPAVAGTNSIDLINLAVKDSSGNLGIGTASPNSYSGYTALTLDNATNGGIIDIERNGTLVGEMFTSDANTFTLAAVGSKAFTVTTNSVTRMTINNNGYVTTPSQPGWHGTHSDNYGTTYSTGTVHNMTTGHNNEYNNGNHFDYSTDRFTVPVTGYYLLYGWDLRAAGTVASGGAIGAWKNGTGSGNRIVSNYHEQERSYSFTTVAYLAVNDWVSFGCTEGGFAQAFYGSHTYSGYGIRLLG